uniref:Uncharacterized protein n=1 Tax=Triticum urartu TaxID=4572 RepID=A0A8R7TK77_TRIUA
MGTRGTPSFHTSRLKLLQNPQTNQPPSITGEQSKEICGRSARPPNPFSAPPPSPATREDSADLTQRQQQKERREQPAMAMVASTSIAYHKPRLSVVCRKKDRDRELEREKEHKHPFKVVEITPPPRCLGVRCFPTNIHCGESVTIEGQAYTVSAVTHRYQLRKGRYEPSEKRLDVLSTGRYILNLYLDSLLDKPRTHARIWSDTLCVHGDHLMGNM